MKMLSRLLCSLSIMRSLLTSLEQPIGLMIWLTDLDLSPFILNVYICLYPPNRWPVMVFSLSSPSFSGCMNARLLIKSNGSLILYIEKPTRLRYIGGNDFLSFLLVPRTVSFFEGRTYTNGNFWSLRALDYPLIGMSLWTCWPPSVRSSHWTW